MSETLKVLFEKKTERFVLRAKVPQDKMKLFVEVEPIKRDITADHLLEQLMQVKGIERADLAVLEDVASQLQRGEKAVDRRILKGVPAEPGVDGKLLLLVKPFAGGGAPVSAEKGKSTFTELHLFDNIAKGQVIGRIYAPKAGKDGVNAIGDTVKAPSGAAVKVTLEKGLTRRAHGDGYEEIVSEVAGYVSNESGKLAVRSELLVKGDLDYGYGSINFVGKVVVSGDVLPGFNIRAQQGIEVKGSVRGGSLISPDGDITVKGFVFGGEQSRVISGKSFRASVVQAVRAEIRGAITIDKEARDSSLRSQTTIHLPQGVLLGGETYTVCGIEAKQLGNEAFLKTAIYLCSQVETTYEYTQLLAEIANHDKAESLLKLHLGPYADAPARLKLLQPSLRTRMEAFLSKLGAVKKSRVALLAKRDELLAKSQSSDALRVNVLGTLYPGVEVHCEGETFAPKDPIAGPQTVEFKRPEKTFVAGALQQLECSLAETSGTPPVQPDQQKESHGKAK